MRPQTQNDSLMRYWLVALGICIAYLTLSYPTTFAFDHPTHTAIGSCSALAALCLSIYLLRPQLFPSVANDAPSIPLYRTIFPEKQLHPGLRRLLLTHDEGLKDLIAVFIIFVLAALFRIEANRLLHLKSQCAPQSWTTFTPLLYMALDLTLQHRFESSTSSQYWHSISLNRFKNELGPSLVAALGAFIITSNLPHVNTTFFCPQMTWTKPLTLMYRLLIPPVDAVLLFSLNYLVRYSRDGQQRHQKVQYPIVVASAGLIISLVVLLEGFVLHFRQSEYRQWSAMLTLGIATPDPSFTMALVAAGFSGMQIIARLGVRHMLMLMLIMIPFLTSLSAAWRSSLTDVAPSFWTIQLGTLILFSGFLWHSKQHAGTQTTSLKDTIHTSHVTPRFIFLSLLTLLLLQAGIWSRVSVISFDRHPVDLLIEKALRSHEDWKQQAFVSKDLKSAAAEYRRRYSMNPPPRFDRWYSYSSYQGAKTLDDFDSIFEDLLPFWSMRPAEIRQATVDLISNPYNFVGGVLIRRGRPQVAPYVPESHRWMVEGVVAMIHPFTKWLPDMDIAFNLNDEPRIAVPYEQLHSMREAGRETIRDSFRGTEDFKTHGHSWPDVPAEALEFTPFHESSFRNSFDEYGTAACPPQSLALNERHWDHSELCTHCKAKHSSAQFVANWTLASDPCHQPDLRHLHGFYASPSSLRNGHKLLPVFSQSKPQRYSDILYPSAWNYVDKVAYDPDETWQDIDWSEKASTLFWRGGTSEGYSTTTDAWTGFGRQRLAHMVNNATSDDSFQVLIQNDAPTAHPNRLEQQVPGYHYGKFHLQTLQQSLWTDIHIVEDIVRCRDSACDVQYEEFKPYYHPAVPFQSHWQYKYLMDMDGAGFSGRFLPFLQSGSLPFKASIMREWWDSRLTAWVHFVPVDMRLTELWSLLAYFAGWRDSDNGNWLMNPHDKQAAQIAEAGRRWANDVLTKEDMEAYFFRLLLEWARLTDDNRDSLGYAR